MLVITSPWLRTFLSLFGPPLKGATGFRTRGDANPAPILRGIQRALSSQLVIATCCRLMVIVELLTTDPSLTIHDRASMREAAIGAPGAAAGTVTGGRIISDIPLIGTAYSTSTDVSLKYLG